MIFLICHCSSLSSSSPTSSKILSNTSINSFLEDQQGAQESKEQGKVEKDKAGKDKADEDKADEDKVVKDKADEDKVDDEDENNTVENGIADRWLLELFTDLVKVGLI